CQLFMKTEGSRRAAKLLFGVSDCIVDHLCLIAADLTGDVLRFARYQITEAVVHSGQWSGVVGEHGKAKGNDQKQVGELGEVESFAALGTGDRSLYAEPGHHDDGESAKEVQARGFKKAELARQEIGDRLADEIEYVLSAHNLNLAL